MGHWPVRHCWIEKGTGYGLNSVHLTLEKDPCRWEMDGRNDCPLAPYPWALRVA